MPHPILPIRATPPSPPLSGPVDAKVAIQLPSGSGSQESDIHGLSGSKTMKAVLWQGHVRDVVVREVSRPQLRKDGELLIRITTAAICGTDLHTYHGLVGGNDIPYVMGHEAVGIVVEVGKDVTDSRGLILIDNEDKLGDRVIVKGGEFDAQHALTYGVGDGLGGANIGGLQAEYAIAPDSGILTHIPSGFENELDYVLCADVFATGWWSITQTGFEAGDVVAIYGAGPVGLMAAYSALLRGASKVYSIDRVPSRLAKAEAIGAIAIDLSKGRPSEQLHKLEPNDIKRVADCVGFECVNVQGELDESFVINDALSLVASGGGIAVTGVYWAANPGPGQPLITIARGRIQFDIATMWLKGITIMGGFVNLAIEPQLIALIQSGRAKPSFVFDTIVSIDEAPEAYRLFSEHKIQKAAIRFFP